MSTPVLIMSFAAEAVINPYRIVKAGATDFSALQASAATDKSIGVSDNLGCTTIGGRCDVVLLGVAEVKLGGTVTRADLLTADATGQGVSAGPSAGVNNPVIGRALQSGVSGDIIRVLLAPSTLQG